MSKNIVFVLVNVLLVSSAAFAAPKSCEKVLSAKVKLSKSYVSASESAVGQSGGQDPNIREDGRVPGIDGQTSTDAHPSDVSGENGSNRKGFEDYSNYGDGSGSEGGPYLVP